MYFQEESWKFTGIGTDTEILLWWQPYAITRPPSQKIFHPKLNDGSSGFQQQHNVCRRSGELVSLLFEQQIAVRVRHTEERPLLMHEGKKSWHNVMLSFWLRSYSTWTHHRNTTAISNYHQECHKIKLAVNLWVLTLMSGVKNRRFYRPADNQVSCDSMTAVCFSCCLNISLASTRNSHVCFLH